jgi:hypothetical protein
MNNRQYENWKFEVISQILIALAKNEHLKNNLVFKGALILNKYLPTQRKSLDIDANFVSAFINNFPSRERQKSFLKKHLEQAISRHFETQDPVRFELLNLRIEPKPRDYHPRRWDAFLITISLTDHENTGVRGLPNLTIDVSAPESLSENSLREMSFGGSKIQAYSLERIAGEKARAFLSTLRTYRDKVEKPGKAVRLKDLYDLTRIIRARTISDRAFWNIAGSEFKLACESRFVDCSGVDSFREGWSETSELYKKSPAIPMDIPFEEVTASISAISNYWKETGIIPFSFPLPVL